MERREIPPNPEIENRKPLRIAICSTPWLPVPPEGYGGIEVLIYDYLLHYPKENLKDFLLFTVGETANRATAEYLKGQIEYFYKEEQYKNIQEPGAPVKEANHIACFYEKLEERIKNGEHFDLVHHNLMFMGGIFAFGEAAKIPHLITTHGPIEDPNDIDFLHMISKRPGIYFNSISDNQRRNLPDLPWIGTVYNGVNCEQFKYSPMHRSYLLNIGRINKEKGQKTAIEVAKKCKKTLILAGNIENNDYFNLEIAPLLEVRIDQLGSGFTKLDALDMILSNAKHPEVIYFGEANFEEKVKLYQHAHAFINPIAWEEPYGLVMPEAGACGTPVISFARGAAPEIIVNGKTGFLVEYKEDNNGIVDISGLVKAVGKIDQIWRPECREHIEAKFSAEAVAKRYREVYDLILEKEREIKSIGGYVI